MRKIIILLLAFIVLTACWACTARQAAGPDDKTWLSPAKIQVNNFNPGNSVTQKIQIHNGKDTARTFSVYYRVPDYVEKFFVVAPAEAREWIVFSEGSPVVGPREIKEIEVVLSLPTEAITPARWEFWIGVKEDKANSLSTELCSRWLITMKNTR